MFILLKKIVLLNKKYIHQGFPNFFQMAPFKEIKKPMAPFNNITQTTIKNTKDFLFCSSSSTLENLVQVSTYGLPLQLEAL